MFSQRIIQSVPVKYGNYSIWLAEMADWQRPFRSAFQFPQLEEAKQL
jgi:hypothetical protein